MGKRRTSSTHATMPVAVTVPEGWGGVPSSQVHSLPVREEVSFGGGVVMCTHPLQTSLRCIKLISQRPSNMVVIQGCAIVLQSSSHESQRGFCIKINGRMRA